MTEKRPNWWVNLADIEAEFGGLAFGASLDRLRAGAVAGPGFFERRSISSRDYLVIPLYVPMPIEAGYSVVYGRVAVAFDDGEHRGDKASWDGESRAYGLGSLPLGDPIPQPPLPDLPLRDAKGD